MEKSSRARIGLGFGLFIAFALSGCGREGVTPRIPQAEPPMAKTPGADSELRLPPVTAKLRNTHYYTIFESDYAGDPSSNVIDVSGRVLATVSAKFYKDLLMEGSGIARTGRVLNYTAKVGGVSRYEISPNPWGNGVGHCALRPFHTIAVDRSVIPLGSTVYIDETKGMPLPDGTLHDGIWRADDIGSAIQKDRVDLYVGKRAWNTALSHYKIDHLQALSVRILALPDGESCVHH